MALEWRSLFRQLYGAGVIAQDVGGYGGWTVTERGRAILKGGATVELRKSGLKPAATKRAARAGHAASLLPPADQPLFEALKALRYELASEQRVPAYVVFADRSLIDMARLKPRDKSEMLLVHGVGQAKWDRFGAAFLRVIREYA